ncbi:hypothetical protein D918_08833 [Trichuris suis]|nr:hypothetical protein D918_08833 [Trichuris suis]
MEKAREFQKTMYFCFIDYTEAFDYVDHNKLWEALKQMGVLVRLTSLLKSLYANQEAAVRTAHGTTDWFEVGKGVRQDWPLPPYLFNLYAEGVMRNARLNNRNSESTSREEILIN